MNIELKIDHQTYSADLNKGKSIAITLIPDGAQPNHFGAPECTSETLIAGDFVADTRQGGSCNVNKLSMIPHCNGTHTESISHIVNQLIPVYQSIENSLFPSVVISVVPVNAYDVTDNYIPKLDVSVDVNNHVITKQQLESCLNGFSEQQLQGLVIRTLPNQTSKQSRIYDNNHYPPFLSNDAMTYLVKRKVKHLMVDFPSVDKMYDEGKLSNHRIFWSVELGSKILSAESTTNKTITEMVFVNDEIEDGFYLCNLQIPEIETDAVPSRPVLYKLS